jgi:hypothetical protein
MKIRLSAVLAIAAAFALVALLPATADAQLNRVDHYKCYDVLDWEDFPQIPVKLGDQFGFTSNEVVSPAFLCNPVSKNGEVILYPDVHLVCYRIIQEQPDPERRVLISNQFHDIQMSVKDGRLLCVPSKKTELQ